VFTAYSVLEFVQCACFYRLKMQEVCAAKEVELTSILQNCSRLENELASVQKVRFILPLLDMLMSLGAVGARAGNSVDDSC